MKKWKIFLILCCFLPFSVHAGDPRKLDGEYNPEIDPQDFGFVIDNPYFPLIPGTVTVLEGETDEGTEVIIVEVTHKTRTVMGIECVVVRDRVWINGEMVEDTDDWYTQDKDGNVWYMGEESKDYKNGEFISFAGSWEAGVKGAIPGVYMHADPQIGVPYYQEYWRGEAEDMAEAMALGVTVTTPYGTHENCVKLKEWNPMELGSREYKYFAPGTGFVLEEAGTESIAYVKTIQESEVEDYIAVVESREYNIPLGLEVSLEAGVEDANDEGSFYLQPGILWTAGESGFSLGADWAVPVAPEAEAGVLTFSEEYEQEMEGGIFLLYAGNENALELEQLDDSEGTVYGGVEVYELVGWEFSVLYMPDFEIENQISLGYEWDFGKKGILEMSAAQNFLLYEDLELSDLDMDVNYSYPLGAFWLTAGVEPVLEIEKEDSDYDVTFLLTPYFVGTYSF